MAAAGLGNPREGSGMQRNYSQAENPNDAGMAITPNAITEQCAKRIVSNVKELSQDFLRNRRSSGCNHSRLFPVMQVNPKAVVGRCQNYSSAA